MAKRAKQQRIPGTEEPSHPDVDGAAEAYYDAVRERLPYTKAEAECKENLINKMIEHGLSRYITDDGLTVDLVDTKNVRVKKSKDKEDGEE